MIRLGESYLAVLYDYLHQKLYNYHVIQEDKTPVLVNRDGRSAGSKSYMWVYLQDIYIPINRASCMIITKHETAHIHESFSAIILVSV